MESLTEVARILGEPAATGEEIARSLLVGLEMVAHLGHDCCFLAGRERAVVLGRGDHHGGGRLARVLDQVEGIGVGLFPPAPAAEEAACVLRGLDDVARGVRRHLHAPKQHADGADRADDG